MSRFLEILSQMCYLRNASKQRKYIVVFAAGGKAKVRSQRARGVWNSMGSEGSYWEGSYNDVIVQKLGGKVAQQEEYTG